MTLKMALLTPIPRLKARMLMADAAGAFREHAHPVAKILQQFWHQIRT